MSLDLPLGFRFAGISCGIKQQADTRDISLILSDAPACAVGVYTQNQVVAAPVLACRRRTPTSQARAVVVNSGNANACTGSVGERDAQRMCALAASACGADVGEQQVLVMSTGVIGHTLPMDCIERGIQRAAEELDTSETAFLNAADGFLTTDVNRKIATRTISLDGRTVRLAGIAKGAGMIGPNMATMLCLILTDADIDPETAHRLLQPAVDRSFNSISVEGHTSTNDTVLMLANGLAAGSTSTDARGSLSAADESTFARELNDLCVELAKQIPVDGEGAAHLIEVNVSGAATQGDAETIARCVASSNLVKTAVYGNDPNWGRIVSAAGYAGPAIEMSQLQLILNNVKLFDQGEPIAFDASHASRSMRDQQTVVIELVVGSGPGKCTHWTSDLSVEYVRFNSEYTT